MSEQHAPPRPGPVRTAAGLALAQAGLLLLLVLAVTVGALAGREPGGGVGVAALACIGACSLAGLDLYGALSLLHGGGRTLPLVTAGAGAGVAGLLLLAGLVDLAVRRPADPTAGLAAALVLLALLGAGVARLVLLTRPAVPARAAAAAVPQGLLVAALAPVAALAVVATVTLALTGGSVLVAGGPLGGGYRGTGEPAEPPAPGDRDHDPAFAGLAAACRDGDMVACDDLYFETPIGDPYETYGSTCGGRLDDETAGGCVAVFGPTD